MCCTSGGPDARPCREVNFFPSAAEQKEVFKKFVRGAGSKAAGVKGTGLGLAMVHHIARAHRGKVLVESELGAGSTFTLLLPLEG
jgi:two-component system phosphate regulon sensor histidine kinase PhoR